MEQLINSMLANVQVPQKAPAAKKSDAPQKDDFQKLMEQKQGTDSPEAPRKEKTEAVQDTQEPQEAQAVQETQEQVQPAAPKGAKELEEQMLLAAMAMMQNPVVPAEQVVTPEVQAEVAAADVAPEAAEVLLAPEAQSLAPEKELFPEIPMESEAAETAVDQTLAEELPQTVIEAPETVQKPEERTVEIKVEEGTEELSQAEETTEGPPELQDAEVETPVFENVKAVPVKVGEAPKTEQAQQPVEEQIVAKLTEAVQNGETRVELQLTPEHLGKVKVEMTWKEDGSLVVEIHAENRETQNLLNKNASGLEALLGREVQQEVRVEAPRQEESQRQDLYEQQQRQHRQQQERQEQQHKGHPADSENFLQQLRLGLIPMEGE